MLLCCDCVLLLSQPVALLFLLPLVNCSAFDCWLLVLFCHCSIVAPSAFVGTGWLVGATFYCCFYNNLLYSCNCSSCAMIITALSWVIALLLLSPPVDCCTFVTASCSFCCHCQLNYCCFCCQLLQLLSFALVGWIHQLITAFLIML